MRKGKVTKIQGKGLKDKGYTLHSDPKVASLHAKNVL